MAKNNYNGTEVYVHKLIDGTKFYVNNGGWEGEFKIIDGIPRVIVNGEDTCTVSENKILNITTHCEIPKSAYVYKSSYYANEIKSESRKLAELSHMIENELLDTSKLRKVKISLKNSSENLYDLFDKFYDMKEEEHID